MDRLTLAFILVLAAFAFFVVGFILHTVFKYEKSPLGIIASGGLFLCVGVMNLIAELAAR